MRDLSLETSMKKLNRREFLETAAVIGAGIGVGAVLSGCKGGGTVSCGDTTGLSEADLGTRTAMDYVEASTEAGKTCSNCALFTADPGGGCGLCSVVKGPINPAGNCSVWAELAG